jgi:hypothetical protein
MVDLVGSEWCCHIILYRLRLDWSKLQTMNVILKPDPQHCIMGPSLSDIAPPRRHIRCTGAGSSWFRFLQWYKKIYASLIIFLVGGHCLCKNTHAWRLCPHFPQNVYLFNYKLNLSFHQHYNTNWAMTKHRIPHGKLMPDLLWCVGLGMR